MLTVSIFDCPPLTSSRPSPGPTPHPGHRHAHARCRAEVALCAVQASRERDDSLEHPDSLLSPAPHSSCFSTRVARGWAMTDSVKGRSPSAGFASPEARCSPRSVDRSDPIDARSMLLPASMFGAGGRPAFSASGVEVAGHSFRFSATYSMLRSARVPSAWTISSCNSARRWKTSGLA
jgi:hypothetical protein